MLKFLPRIVAVLLVPCLATGQLRPQGAVRPNSHSAPELFLTQTLVGRAAEAWNSWKTGHASIKREEAYAGGFPRGKKSFAHDVQWPDRTMAMVNESDTGSNAAVQQNITWLNGTGPYPGKFVEGETLAFQDAAEVRKVVPSFPRTKIEVINREKEIIVIVRGLLRNDDGELEGPRLFTLDITVDPNHPKTALLGLGGSSQYLQERLNIFGSKFSESQWLTSALIPWLETRGFDIRVEHVFSPAEPFLKAGFHWDRDSLTRERLSTTLSRLTGPPAMMRNSSVGKQYDRLLASFDSLSARGMSGEPMKLIKELLLDKITGDAPLRVDLFYFVKVIKAHQANLERLLKGEPILEALVADAAYEALARFFIDHQEVVGKNLHWRASERPDWEDLGTLFIAIRVALDALYANFAADMPPDVVYEFEQAAIRLVVGKFEDNNMAFAETGLGVPAMAHKTEYHPKYSFKDIWDMWGRFIFIYSASVIPGLLIGWFAGWGSILVGVVIACVTGPLFWKFDRRMEEKLDDYFIAGFQGDSGLEHHRESDRYNRWAGYMFLSTLFAIGMVLGGVVAAIWTWHSPASGPAPAAGIVREFSDRLAVSA